MYLGKIPAMLNVSKVMYLGIITVPGYRQQSQQVIRRVSVQDLGGREKDLSVGERKLQRL